MSIIPEKSIKELPSGRYQAVWYINRKQHRQSFTTRRLAEDFLLQQRISREREDVYGRDNKVPINDIIAQYRAEVKKSPRSKELESSVIPRLLTFLQSKRIRWVSQISKADMADYETRRRMDDVSQRTINLEIKMLSAALNHATRHDRISHNPLALYPYKPEYTPFPRFMTLDEIHQFLDGARAIGHHDLFYAILTLGLRSGEATHLRYSDIKNDMVHIGLKKDWSPKWNKERWIPIDEEYVNDAYMQKLFTSGKGLCFPHPRRDEPMSRRYVLSKFRVALNNTKIKNSHELVVHTLRHTHISYMVARIGHAKHISLRTIMEYVGINDYATMMRYSQAVKNLAKNLPDPERLPWQITA